MKAFKIDLSDIERCPIKSVLPAHYNDDGTCKCEPEDVVLLDLTEIVSTGADQRRGVITSRFASGAFGLTMMWPVETQAEATDWLPDLGYLKRVTTYLTVDERKQLIAKLQEGLS